MLQSRTWDGTTGKSGDLPTCTSVAAPREAELGLVAFPDWDWTGILRRLPSRTGIGPGSCVTYRLWPHHEVRDCVVGFPLLQSAHQRINVQQQLSSGHNERRYCNSVRIFIHLVFSFLIPQRAINVLSGDHWAPHVEEPNIQKEDSLIVASLMLWHHPSSCSVSKCTMLAMYSDPWNCSRCPRFQRRTFRRATKVTGERRDQVSIIARPCCPATSPDTTKEDRARSLEDQSGTKIECART